jgi:hypothetical protein
MINHFIKHTAPQGIFSAYNPILTLKPKIRRRVNNDFILPIVKAFFGYEFDNYEEFNPDKLKTEVEFNAKDLDENFTQSYVYKEIVNNIAKPDKSVVFKPKYVITFDSDLTNWETKGVYPHNQEPIKYGVIQLGNAPILYYIYIYLQDLITFIKNIPIEEISEETEIVEKDRQTAKDKQNRLVDVLLLENHQKMLKSVNEEEKEQFKANEQRLLRLREEEIEGQSGELRIRLMWDTEDDLDLHILAPNGEIIHYNKKKVECDGVIGELDVDKNASEPFVTNPQENVYWSKMPKGKYVIKVHFYSSRQATKVDFTVLVIPNDNNLDGRSYQDSVESTGINQEKEIATFEYLSNENKINYIPN